MLYEQVANFMSSNVLSTNYVNTLSMMTPEEMRVRYLTIVGDNFAFNDEQNMVDKACSTQDELLRLCKLLHSYILFINTLNSFGK